MWRKEMGAYQIKVAPSKRMRISKINRTFFDKIVFIWTGRRKWIEVKNKKTERDNKTHKYSNMYKYTKIHIQVTRFSILVNFFFIRSVNSVFYGDDRRSLLWLLDASTQNFCIHTRAFRIVRMRLMKKIYIIYIIF